MKFLNSQTKSVSFASLILAGAYFVSALLGLLRDRLLAGQFGAGNELDVYYTAFVVPDFIALMFVFGAISAAIIPIFSSYLITSKEEAFRYASSLFNVFLACLIVICAVLMIFAPFFVSLIAPGFSEEKREVTASLMRIIFLSPIILGTSNIISGILQVFHRFLVTALAPVMYNVGIIIGIVLFVPWWGLKGLALGVVLGGLLHLAIQLPALMHAGFRYVAARPEGQKRFFPLHPGVVKTLVLMVPRSLGLGAGQINTIATTAIASTLVSGSVAVFNLANNLSGMLINAIAVSLSTAIFPALSLAHSKADMADFERKFSGAFRQILFLTIPFSFLIFILRAQIARVVWGWGRFGWIDTRLTAACLGVFALGLCFQGLIFIFSKTFYAAHNTKIPAIASVLTVACNIALSLWFVWQLRLQGTLFSFIQRWLRLEGIDDIGVVGLALAYSITAVAESLLLLWFLYRKFDHFHIKNVWDSLSKIIISTAAMSGIALVTRQLLVEFHIVELQTFAGVFLQLAVSGAVGAAVYIYVARLLKSPEFATIKESFFKKNVPGTY